MKEKTGAYDFEFYFKCYTAYFCNVTMLINQLVQPNASNTLATLLGNVQSRNNNELIFQNKHENTGQLI